MISAFFLASLLLGAETLDLEMSSQEKKETGIYKLSSKQKASLQKWIDSHYAKREEPSSQDLSEKAPLLSENLRSGKYIRLSDDSLWEIRPKDAPISQAWITPVKILVSQSEDSSYPYKLTNSVTEKNLKKREIVITQSKIFPLQNARQKKSFLRNFSDVNAKQML